MQLGLQTPFHHWTAEDDALLGKRRGFWAGWRASGWSRGFSYALSRARVTDVHFLQITEARPTSESMSQTCLNFSYQGIDLFCPSGKLASAITWVQWA